MALTGNETLLVDGQDNKGRPSGVVFQTTTQAIANLAETSGIPYVKRVTTVANATSITPNSSTTDIVYQNNTQTAGTLTINADVGSPLEGQSLLFKIKSTNAQTFAWNAQFTGGTNGLPPVTTGSGLIDYFAFIYDTVELQWHFTGSAMGF